MPRDWNAYYSDPAYTEASPDPLLVEVAGNLAPGEALDIACGTGRHAIHLARLGWQVTAVDSSPAAIALLRRSAPEISAKLVDLEQEGFAIEPDRYDLICDFFYLQRDLFPAMRAGVCPGGTFVGAIHILESGRNPAFSLHPGQLRQEFAGWKILYYSEGGEPGRSRRSARIIARRA